MFQQTIRYEDFPNICRFCLTQRSTEIKLTKLFDDLNISLSKTLNNMVDHCLRIKLNKNDDMPPLICSVCLKKLLSFNAFRKQCIATEYQLKLILNDFKERKLFENIDDGLEKENSDEIELIEYIDETMEFAGASENDDDDVQGEEEEEENIFIELETQNDEIIKSDEIQIYDEQEHSSLESESINETVDSFDESEMESKPSKSKPKSKSKSKSKRAQNSKAQLRQSCKICGKMVVNLKPHMETHVELENRRKPYRCEHCGKEYLQRAQFDSHVNKEHTGLKPFKCDQCDKTFHGRPGLRMHKISHSTERRFTCEFCPRSYLYAHHLSHHRYTHTKERIFSCSQCDYTNVHMENLKRHILSKHTEDEDKPYKCEHCGRSFNGQSNLKRHLKYVHNEVTAPANSRSETQTTKN